MQKVLHLKTKVLPGGKIEIVHRELPVGKSVDVVVRHSSESARRSAVDILAEAPGQRLQGANVRRDDRHPKHVVRSTPLR